jgi:two-component system response regulator MprA
VRILVVDDDRAVRESLRRSLQFNGYDVDVAADGAEALARVPTTRMRTDLACHPHLRSA